MANVHIFKNYQTHYLSSAQKAAHAPQRRLLFTSWISECPHMAQLGASTRKEHSDKNIIIDNQDVQVAFYRRVSAQW